jgi:hypothetical protein
MIGRRYMGQLAPLRDAIAKTFWQERDRLILLK